MRTIYLFFCALLFINSAFAGRTIKAINNGRWSTASTWDLNRKPNDGDTVLIPVSVQVELNSNETLNNLIVKVAGTLRLNNGKLNLNTASRIEIMQEGRLTGSGNNDQVRIGNVFKFRGGVDLVILGAAYADTSTGVSPHGFTGGYALLQINNQRRIRLNANYNESVQIYSGNRSVHVKFNQPLYIPTAITVLDLNGRVVAKRSFGKQPSHISLQLQGEASGMYVVHLADSRGKKISGRVIL